MQSLPSDKQALVAFAILATIVTGWMAVASIYVPLNTWGPYEDFWEHSAALKELISNPWSPGNPHLAIDVGSPRYMPLFYSLAFIARLFGLTAIEVLQLSAVINTALFMVGIRLFFYEYFRNSWAPLIGLLVLLGFWGFGWRSSNQYDLRTLFYVASYPSFFVFSISLSLFWMTLRILNKDISIWIGSATLSISLAFSIPSHPLTAAFTVASILLLAYTTTSASTRDRIMIVASAIVGLIIAEQWPLFSTISLATGTIGGEGMWLGTMIQDESAWTASIDQVDASRSLKILAENHFYQPTAFLTAIGPCLIGLGLIYLFLIRGSHQFITIGFMLMMVPYVAFLLMPIAIGFRFIFYAIFFLHMAIIAQILEMSGQNNANTKNGSKTDFSIAFRTVIGVLIVIFLVRAAIVVATQAAVLTTESRSTIAVMEDIANQLPEKAITLAPEKLSWPLPTFKGKTVGLAHGNPFVTNQDERNRATTRFFQGNINVAEKLQIAANYGVTHIVIENNFIRQDVRLFLAERAALVQRVPGPGPDSATLLLQILNSGNKKPAASSMVSIYSLNRPGKE